ncbi:MAG: virulence protein RhuM/Fic/DOC family protein (plasmid) [Candidatus Symbiodolus clandestinus]
MNQLVIYQPDDGSAVSVRLEGNTLWLTQRQLAELFATSTDNISLHLKNIYSQGELAETATTEDFSVVQKEGQRSVSRKVKHYNLDAIISVGYRVNSKCGMQFRQWATGILRAHLMQGWTLDRTRFEHNAAELEAALALVRKTAQSPYLLVETGRGLIEIVSRYTLTFLLLQRYDTGTLTEPTGTSGGLMPSLYEVRHVISRLKTDLIARGEAVYPTVESKESHLLYFVIKNHPLVDGNKRIGALLFIHFLNQNNSLMREGQPIINNIGLAALALLIAESAAEHKETMVRLIQNMLVGTR